VCFAELLFPFCFGVVLCIPCQAEVFNEGSIYKKVSPVISFWINRFTLMRNAKGEKQIINRFLAQGETRVAISRQTLRAQARSARALLQQFSSNEGLEP
jgi:hypothetical protein